MKIIDLIDNERCIEPNTIRVVGITLYLVVYAIFRAHIRRDCKTIYLRMIKEAYTHPLVIDMDDVLDVHHVWILESDELGSRSLVDADELVYHRFDVEVPARHAHVELELWKRVKIQNI